LEVIRKRRKDSEWREHGAEERELGTSNRASCKNPKWR
jgi:hypothetical protein